MNVDLEDAISDHSYLGEDHVETLRNEGGAVFINQDDVIECRWRDEDTGVVFSVWFESGHFETYWWSKDDGVYDEVESDYDCDFVTVILELRSDGAG
jgi:hypothetical protein